MGKVMKLMTEQVSEMATMLKSKENQGFFESLLVRSELESPIAQGHKGLLKEGSKPTNNGAAHVPQSNSPKEKEKGSGQVSLSLNQSYQPTAKGMNINTNTEGNGGGFVISVPAHQKTAPLGGQAVDMHGRKTFVAMMKISSLKDLMPEVKVGESIDTNREVNEKRVAELAEYYVRAGDRVVIPPILADTHLDFEFKKEGEIEVGVGNAANKIAVGILQVPLAIDDAMIILDGQHRVAGLVKAYRETMSKLKNLRDEKGRLEDQESDPLQRERLRSVNTEIATSEALEARFNRDTVTVEIRTNTPRDLHKEWFVTIADNAKGINKSERARLDTINMSSLVAKKVCDKHILLSGNIGDSGQPRVDFRNNMAKRSSDTIYSLDNVRNVVKNIAFSAEKKETAKLERSMVDKSDDVVAESLKFFDALVSNVSEYEKLSKITSGYTGATFRKESLYGSPTMLRALAGAYHSLVLKDDTKVKAKSGFEIKHNSTGYKQFTELLSNLNQFMDLKVYEQNIGEIDIHPKWRATTLFRESGLAPQSGFQDLAKLVELLTDWGKLGKVFSGSVYSSILKPGA
jgi:hypothetical protein